MILLLRPAPPFVEFCKVEDGVFSVERAEFRTQAIDEVIGDADQIEGIGHLLYHGGEEFGETMSVLDKAALDKMGRCIGLFPEYNELTLKMARMIFEKLPEIPQMLFCSTAYFADLPEEAGIYAVPYELRRQGIRRYGGYGLIHRSAWQRTRDIDERLGRIISVHLGDNPNIAAIDKGRPIETTIGFTSAEGLPSSRGCGDIDPTIVFQLNSMGMSFEGIYDLLSNESGFTGIAGEECHYLDLVDGKDTPGRSKARRILIYGMIKYIGAFVSLLGGADAIVFIAKDLDRSKGFVEELCGGLAFLGISGKDAAASENSLRQRRSESSKTDILYFEESQWNIMARGIKEMIIKET